MKPSMSGGWSTHTLDNESDSEIVELKCERRERERKGDLCYLLLSQRQPSPQQPLLGPDIRLFY